MTFFLLPLFFFGALAIAAARSRGSEPVFDSCVASATCAARTARLEAGWLADLAKPLQQRRIDLGRTLLLDPVPGAIDDADEPQIGDVLSHHFDEVDAGDEGKNGVKLAGDEGCRPLDAAAHDLRLLGEVELCRTVAVERSAEAALLELPEIVVEISGREPGR